jgi:glycosyltransferase involved in cell wall biosynthesis
MSGSGSSSAAGSADGAMRESGASAAGRAAHRRRVGFVMCTEAGLKTQYLNWRSGLECRPEVDPVWIEVDWWRKDGLIERLPGIPGGIKARLRAQIELRSGLADGPFDAVFVAAHTLYGLGPVLARQPYFVTSDVTARQMHHFGEIYGKVPSRLAFVEARKHKERCAFYRGAAAVFPWSHWAAHSFIEHYGVEPSRVHVIPPGVDLGTWACPERSSSGPTNILFVGGDFRRKGGDALVRWAQTTRARDWALHLVTHSEVGPVPDGVTLYRGLCPNDPRLVALYRQAEVFALPTRGDCYSLAGIEAMASGLPVVLSATGGTSDIVRDGETGFLTRPGDERSLACALEYLLAHPDERRAMGLRARRDAEERYDARANIGRTVDVMLRHLPSAAPCR